jgi:hypothetical protein
MTANRLPAKVATLQEVKTAVEALYSRRTDTEISEHKVSSE